MRKIGVVICNYNKGEMVVQCIKCILESKFTDFDLFVVDNASTDDSVKLINENYTTEQLTLIVNSENLGGSGGFNTGLRRVYELGYPYLMCVDNDAMLDENAIGNLYDFLEKHDEVGIAASKIYHLEQPDYIQQFGQKIDFKYFCTEVPHLNMLEDGSMPDFLYVDSVAACSLMTRRSTIDKIGFLPEENFLYWDDTEWCYLCNKAGMKVASVGTSQALHAMGAKKEATNTFPTYYAWRNWISFFMKYVPENDFERMTRTMLTSLFKTVYQGLHKNEHNFARTTMLAYDDALHGITGKAAPGRIFTLDKNDDAYRKLFSRANAIYIEEGDFPIHAQSIRERAQKLGYDITWLDKPKSNATTVKQCESIFEIEDLSRKYVYIDIDDCILQTEDDVLDVINYNYSLRTFLYANQPVFLQKLEEFRKVSEGTNGDEVYGK